jgi:hypothetical protein
MQSLLLQARGASPTPLLAQPASPEPQRTLLGADTFGIGWDGNSTANIEPLGKYYLSAMDAMEKHSPGEALYMVQGGGQYRLGTARGGEPQRTPLAGSRSGACACQ